jgi:peptidylprolyl isomerase
MACSSKSEAPSIPTTTPFYTCVQSLPTFSEANPLPTIENVPVPTVNVQPTVTASGLKIFELQAGSGPAAEEGGVIYIKYTQWVQGGNECDSTHVGPVRYQLRKGQVIDGLVEGIKGMKVGEKRRLIIPPELAFGDTGSGNVIPPGATLIYDIELTDVSNPAS